MYGGCHRLIIQWEGILLGQVPQQCSTQGLAVCESWFIVMIVDISSFQGQ